MDIFKRDSDVFADAIAIAVQSAKQTGKDYHILYPYIANRHYPSAYLVVPVVASNEIEPDEIVNVAITVDRFGLLWSTPRGKVGNHD